MKERSAYVAILIGLSAASQCGAAQQQATSQGAQQRTKNIAAHPVSALAEIEVLRDIEYVPGGGNARLLDLYRPKKRAALLPVIVWIHGGGWRNGSKAACPPRPFTTNGFAVASINYRLSGEAPFPAQIDDCRAALNFLRANAEKYNLDTAHIGIWGGSAGGHLVALLGVTGAPSNRVQCVVDWFGPTDLTPSGPYQGKDISFITQFFGGPVQEKLDLARQASPLLHVTKDAPPFLIMQGGQDRAVDPAHSKQLLAALQKVGVEATLKIIPDAGHGGPKFSTPENLQQILKFFEHHLKPEHGSKN